MTCQFARAAHDRGMALIVSLVILVALTLIALAAMQNTALEERMAGSLRAENVAFQAAEGALREAEGWLNAQSTQPIASASGSNPDVWATDADALSTTDWWKTWDWAGKAFQLKAAGLFKLYEGDTGGLTSSAPSYVIQERELVKDSLNLGQQQDLAGRQFYEITAQGLDAGGRGEVLLRSTYARRY